MNDVEAGQHWNLNAEAWTTLARAGFDTYRDYLNTPAFFDILPEVNGLMGIDIGCGEGYNTRILAQKGAQVKGIDISENFIGKAKDAGNRCASNIEYTVANANNLPFENAHFDFATSFMSLMDIPNPEQALREAYRVLKPGGFFQFSISHPCFNTPHRKNLRDIRHQTYAVEVGGYFNPQNGKIDEWIFGGVPSDLKSKFSKFRVPVFNRTLTQWFGLVLETGFSIEQVNEPTPGTEIAKAHPSLQDAQIVAYFLHIRGRK